MKDDFKIFAKVAIVLLIVFLACYIFAQLPGVYKISFVVITALLIGLCLYVRDIYKNYY